MPIAAPLRRGNLFSPPAATSGGEAFESLLAGGTFRLERIVSTGQATPPGEWYDQEADEWVVLLSGSATLRLAEPEETFDLAPGDWVLLPAHRRHRVERTAADVPTVWLAIHFRP
ncbi:MAG TPA: cupin domain-containing protein [Planctomycetaceae bacterium]